ncbi:hypothetical protein NDN01_15565 [Sphingomonas sp. QA11]|uniref:hypothetical protein n=1 Tax=Sphingomonas sp. QA11 TaxID=2950605 RepID=UPI00234ADDA6|nr:hypothetical protein [Sphingomonas sp. QA11]WCM25465.1 hypothetical protein NDN01_15565 [Sphingomonas sp. QA11]
MATDDQDDTNEIIAATRAAKKQREAAAATGDTAKAKRWPLTTIGLGIGSAAVVAALLYANRSRQKR